MGFKDVDSDNKPVSFQQSFEQKRSTHVKELQLKEDEMRQMFVNRVKEKEHELKDEEKEVRDSRIFMGWNILKDLIMLLLTFLFLQLHLKFDKLKKDHSEEKRKLDELRKTLEDDIIEFNRRKQQIAQQQALSPSHHTLTLGKSKKK